MRDIEIKKDKHYKVRLKSGRTLGPLDIARIRLFVSKGIITGLETGCLYPQGIWQDINRYPEIADLLLQKLEGRLEIDTTDIHHTLSPEELIKMDVENTGEENIDEEKTVILSRNEEKTIIRPAVFSNKNPEVRLEGPAAPLESMTDSASTEKTQMLKTRPSTTKEKNKLEFLKKKPVLLALAALAGLFLLMPDETAKTSRQDATPFVVEMPTPAEKPDPAASNKLIVQAMKPYAKDTVDGYRSAARLFKKAVSLDQNNVRAICLLASAYLNLMDVQKRDEAFFSVITRLIEFARAKGVDLSEMVIAEVELYLALGNPEAAMKRLVDFTKTHEYGPELHYYLAFIYFTKSDFENSFKGLGQLDKSKWFSQKIPYLYAQIFLKNNQKDDARKALDEVLKNSPTHIKARVDMLEISFAADKFEDVESHADFVVQNKQLASNKELARALYYRGRVKSSKGLLEESAGDLGQATKLVPGEPNYLLEYYTIRSRLGDKVSDAKGKALMFAELAKAESAMRDGKLFLAEGHYLSARQADEKDALPLVKLANVFRLKGDLLSAKNNMFKAIKLTIDKPDYYPAYIKILIEAYEFEDATKQIEIYKGLGPSSVELDKINGDLNFKRSYYDRAESYYKRALSDANAESSTYNSFADVLFARNNFKDAAFFYGLALRFDTFNVKSISGVAKSMAEIEGLQSGVDTIMAALKINPKKAELANALAEVLLRKGDYQNALKSAEQAHAYDTQLPVVYKTKGDIYVSMDKIREALEAYQSYSNLVPWDPEGSLARYNVFIKRLDYKAAKEEIQKVIDMYPRYPGGYTRLGELYKESSNYKSALEAAKQELVFNPDYIPAFVLAASALNSMKEAQSAMEYINRALKLNQTFVPLLLQAGETNRNLKNYQAAKTLLDRALSQDQGNPQIHKRLGMLYYEMNDKVKGKLHLKAYIDYLPDAKDRAEIERLLSN